MNSSLWRRINCRRQDHTHHVDITDPGHTHSYIDRYSSPKDETAGPDGPHGGFDATFAYDVVHGVITQSQKTGISAKVNGVGTGRHGAETRPKNMKVIYIIRVR